MIDTKDVTLILAVISFTTASTTAKLKIVPIPGPQRPPAELLKPRPLPSLCETQFPKAVGTIDCEYVRVSQIINGQEAMIDFGGKARSVWVTGVDTSQWIDGMEIKLDGIFTVQGNKQYGTSWNSVRTTWQLRHATDDEARLLRETHEVNENIRIDGLLAPVKEHEDTVREAKREAILGIHFGVSKGKEAGRYRITIANTGSASVFGVNYIVRSRAGKRIKVSERSIEDMKPDFKKSFSVSCNAKPTVKVVSILGVEGVTHDRGPCEKCDGTGRGMCLNCLGKTVVTCSMCNGKGKVQKFHKSPDGPNSPFRSTVGEWVTCSKCRGVARLKCTGCDGSGKSQCRKCERK